MCLCAEQPANESFTVHFFRSSFCVYAHTKPNHMGNMSDVVDFRQVKYNLAHLNQISFRMKNVTRWCGKQMPAELNRVWHIRRWCFEYISECGETDENRKRKNIPF